MDTNSYFIPTAWTGTKTLTQDAVETLDATGFGAAADDYAGRGIDLNEQLIRNKPATFFMRVASEAMTGAGIHPGDVVIVDRSLPAADGKIVIAVMDGELIIRQLSLTGSRKRLVPASRKLAAIDLGEAPLQLWGVVTYVIHSV